MTAYDLILSRRSVYEFEPLPIARELVERCIAAAAWAPNLHLTQPWRFAVLQEHARGKAAAAVGAVDGRGGAALAGAAGAVAVIQRVVEDPEVRDADRLAVGAAVENLILCACDEGLGTLWLGGAAVRTPELLGVVAASAEEEVAALVALGYAAAVPPRRPRRSVADSVVWLD